MGVCFKCKKEINSKNRPGIYEVEVFRKNSETGDVLHETCVDWGRFGKCRLCGPLTVHPLRELKGFDNDLCVLHLSEDFTDDEEREGRDEIIENITKNF